MDKASRFQVALLTNDVLELESFIGELFNNLSCQDLNPDKWFWLSMLHAALFAQNLDVRPQVMSYLGKSDLDLVLMGDVYVVIKSRYAKGEIGDDQAKKNRLLDKAVNNALKYIEIKDLGGHYQSRASRIIKMGLGIYGNGLVKVKFGN
jgi:hypothetical protein